MAAPRLGEGASSEIPPLALISWAFVHGLTILGRDGALSNAAGTGSGAAADVARTLVDLFAERMAAPRLG